jgi:hypothetical protein
VRKFTREAMVVGMGLVFVNLSEDITRTAARLFLLFYPFSRVAVAPGVCIAPQSDGSRVGHTAVRVTRPVGCIGNPAALPRGVCREKEPRSTKLFLVEVVGIRGCVCGTVRMRITVCQA